MAVISMPSTHSLVKTLQQDHPTISFVASDQYEWIPTTRTLQYRDESTGAPLILHELAHALLGHSSYKRDIELVRIEQEAWQHARTALASQYSIVIEEEVIEQSLDTYRSWLHQRSTCPHCTATGVQKERFIYNCAACGAQWRVNEAKLCALRRYTA